MSQKQVSTFFYYCCSECDAVHVANAGHNIEGALARLVHSDVVPIYGSCAPSIMFLFLLSRTTSHVWPFRVVHKARRPVWLWKNPAVVELWVQAGVEILDYPSRRSTQLVRMRVIDGGGYVKEPNKPCSSTLLSLLADLDSLSASTSHTMEIPNIAHETMYAYEK